MSLHGCREGVTRYVAKQELLRMDYNRLGHSGLRVPALSFGTGTFGVG